MLGIGVRGLLTGDEYPLLYILPTFLGNPRIEVKLSPERTGYVFYGWNILDTDFSVGDPIILSATGGDVVIAAKWYPKHFGIGYELDGGNPPATPNPTHYTIETLPEKVQHAPTKAGYTFVD